MASNDRTAKVSGRTSEQDREVELKLELPLKAASRLRKLPALAKTASETSQQTSVYFDTPKLRLFRDGYSLRVREAGGRFVQTVKSGGETAGLFSRGEWETPVDALEPDLGALDRTPLHKLAARLRGLKEVMRSEVRRTVWHLDGGGSLIELVLDQAEIRAGEGKIAFGEIEMELKQGPVERMFDLARELGRSVPLRIGVTTKSERGHDLAAGTYGKLRKASPVELEQAMTVAQAFAAIVYACIRHFRLNEDLVVSERDPAALHQARVAMRRLRAGLSLFGPAIRDERFAALREEIRWFTGTLGDARNLDVFQKRHGGELSDAEWRKVERARTRAYATALGAIQSQRLRDLLLELVAWVETGEWRGGRKAQATIAKFAERRLDRQWAKVQTAGSHLERLDDESLHWLRIDIKKLRYAVEFLGSLYRKREVKTFTSALEAMQEMLGEMNDEVTARELFGQLKLRLPERAAADSERTRARQLAAVARQFARLERAGLFWKAPLG